MALPFWIISLSTFWTVLFWICCIAIPFGAVLLNAFVEIQKSPLLIWDPSIWYAFLFTGKQALISTVLSAIGGLVLGLALGQVTVREQKSVLTSLLVVPYGVPTVVSATAWVIWLGRTGIFASLGWKVEWLFSLKAVILAHVFLNIPWIALAVAQARNHVSLELIETSRLLGAGSWAQLRWIFWPQIRWSFLSACSQVFSLCGMSFALVLILGGGPPVQTVETELFQRLRYGAMDLSGAVVCALYELILTFTPWLLILLIQNRNYQKIPQKVFSQKRTHRPKGRIYFQFALIFIVSFFVAPYVVVLSAETFQSFSSPSWRSLIFEPLKCSLTIAGWTAATTVFSASAALLALQPLKAGSRVRSGIEAALGLSSAVSVLVLGLGVWLAYGNWFDLFEGSLTAMVLLQVALFFPLAFRLLLPLTQGTQKPLWDSAVLLGASPLQAFCAVEWPRWRGPILAAWVAVTGASLGEVGAVSLFYSERLIPLPLVISRLMEQYRFAEAQGVAGLLFLLVFTSGIVSWKLGNRILR